MAVKKKRGANSPTSKQTTQTQVKEIEAVALRRLGLNFHKIGERLGCSHEAARRAVIRGLELAASSTRESAMQLRELELERLDALQAGVQATAEAGDVDAVDAVLKIMKQRERYIAVAIAQPKPAEPESEGDKGQPVTITYTMATRTT